MELTILILLLPFFSFLILGIGGKWMSHRTAGTIGTLILGAVAVLSYVTAIQYFSAPRLEDGTFATLIPYNFTWLPFTETLHFDLGILLDPISVMMSEHDTEGERFRHIEKLTNGYSAPEDACNSYQLVLQQLKAFEAALHQHIHLENNIVFPRTIQLETELQEHP